MVVLERPGDLGEGEQVLMPERRSERLAFAGGMRGDAEPGALVRHQRRSCRDDGLKRCHLCRESRGCRCKARREWIGGAECVDSVESSEPSFSDDTHTSVPLRKSEVNAVIRDPIADSSLVKSGSADSATDGANCGVHLFCSDTDAIESDERVVDAGTGVCVVDADLRGHDARRAVDGTGRGGDGADVASVGVRWDTGDANRSESGTRQKKRSGGEGDSGTNEASSGARGGGSGRGALDDGRSLERLDALNVLNQRREVGQ